MANQSVEEKREAIRERLTSLGEKSTSDFIRRDSLGMYSFEEVEEEVSDALGFHRGLRDLPLSEVPAPTLNKFNTRTQAVFNSLKDMLNFNPQEVGDPNTQHAQLIKQFRNAWSQAFDELAPYLAYIQPRGAAVDKAVEEARAKLDEVSKEQVRVLQEVSSASDEADKILQSLRSAAAEAGVEQHATHFSSEAGFHSDQAEFWLKATAGIAGFTALLAGLVVAAYLNEWVTVPSGQWVQVAIGKVVFFSILSFGLVWCGRNYRSHQHNYVVNKHRENALATFRAFTDAASDEATKNGVLLRATEAIFSPGASGYVNTQQEGTHSPQILEFVRNLSEG